MTSLQTTVRANIDGRYYLRILVIGVVAVGFALWSLYDGAVKYPNQRERALAYLELEGEGRTSEWNEYASQRGWPTEPPGDPKTDVDFAMQFIMAGVAGTVGFFLLLVVFLARGRWIEASESGLTSSWGKSFDFDRILSLNKKKWREKGIAKITYENGNRRGRFVLDNFKYDRLAMNMILFEVESKIGIDKIVGGPPEPSPEEHEEAAAEPVPEKSES